MSFLDASAIMDLDCSGRCGILRGRISHFKQNFLYMTRQQNNFTEKNPSDGTILV